MSHVRFLPRPNLSLSQWPLFYTAILRKSPIKTYCTIPTKIRTNTATLAAYLSSRRTHPSQTKSTIYALLLIPPFFRVKRTPPAKFMRQIIFCALYPCHTEICTANSNALLILLGIMMSHSRPLVCLASADIGHVMDSGNVNRCKANGHELQFTRK